MKRFILLLIVIYSVFPSDALAKGRKGTYVIKGAMYEKSGTKIIPNTIFIIEGQNVMTNEKGEYSVNITWETPCSFRLNFIKKRKATRKLNPKYVYLKFGDKQQRCLNQWKKYGLHADWTQNKNVYSRDFFWQ
ncbi:MAG: hypothetical protein ACHQRM_09145 [Bacteroidia bacterium]